MRDFHAEHRAKIIKAILDSKKSVPYWAKQADICHATLYKYLKGESQMTPDNLERVYAALKIPIAGD